MPSFVSNLAALPVRTKAVMAVAAVAILAIAFFMVKLATAPSYATLMTGVDPAQTSKLTAALDEKGIAYQLRSNGTALAVDASQTAQARVALAEQGLGGGAGAGEGFELFDKQKLGASDFQNKVTYQRALEGEISRTVAGVQGVSGAQVQLVLPEEDLFADSSTAATAAVMLDGSGDMLEPGAVRGIAQLVSSSVKGLKADEVTITDGSGQLLWPQGDGATGGTDGATKQAAEASYQRGLEANLNAMLARTLGQGKAQVQVNADLNVDKTTLNKLEYAKRGTPLKTQEETERLRGGGGGAAGGAAGSGANIPPTPRAGAAAPTRTTSARAARRTSGSTRPSRRPRSPPAPSRSSTWP
jgi:flagellar M-ring protein FliF